MPTITPTDAAWAAGFLDGEGCFKISKSPPRRYNRIPNYTIGVNAVQVDPGPLEHLRFLFGGSFHRRTHEHRPGQAQSYIWQSSSRVALAVIHVVRPYLRVKGRQADLLVEMYATTGRKGRRTDGATAAQREAFYRAAKELNRRGVPKGAAQSAPATKRPQLRLIDAAG